MKFNHLQAEEKRIIEEKGTERPHSGEYNNHFKDGVYLCRRCNAPLYDSRAKFQAHCGWPSFDREIPGAVVRKPDPDGIRTEIICASCHGHLGHVFRGEGFTEQNTRHCTNSLALRFLPRQEVAGEKGTVVFGGGCFWCLEAAFRCLCGVEEVTAGYGGGSTANPTYREVCTGTTGHAEVIRLRYDPHSISFKQLLTVFFAIHDPTTVNRQGADVGEQYRSVIFYTTWEQKIQTEEFILELTEDGIYPDPIVTEVLPLIEFYPAEEEHQNYFQKHPQAAYCQAAIAPKLSKLKDKYQALLV